MVRAVAVLGASYCGSTVLSFVLGAHPQIANGSELWRLLHPSVRARCAICGLDCRYWTESAVARIVAGGHGELYRNVAQVLGRPVVCDSSKNPAHFREVVRSDGDTDMVFIALSKHPVRHAASFLTNNLVGDNDPSALRDAETVRAQIRTVVQRLERFWDSIDRRSGSFERRGPVLHLRYEDVVKVPLLTLEPALEVLGLATDPSMVDFTGKEHHPVGGNMGPRVQTLRRRGESPKWGARSEYRRRFYEGASGLVLDDKYRELPAEVMQQMLVEPALAALCQRLGYPMGEPTG